MIFSHSRVELYEQCPYKFALRYIDGLGTLPNYQANDPLLLGTAMHTAIEKDAETAIAEYYNSFPIIGDEHINEAMKIEILSKKVKAIISDLDPTFETPIHGHEFIGFADCLLKCGENTYLLVDFKYSNNVSKYEESKQLHLYKYFLEEKGYNIPAMYYIFIPKVEIKQKKTESIMEFRKRLKFALETANVAIKEIEFDYTKVEQFMAEKDQILNAIQNDYFPKKESKLCHWCEFESYCEGGHDWMILPSTERRPIGAAKRRKIWIYGEPFSGKTTMLDKAPNPLNLNTDGNVTFVTMPYVPIKDLVTVEGRITKRKYAWEVFKETIEELEKKQNDFQTIIVDLLEDTREMCRIFKYEELGIDHESDAGYGKGWDIIKTEYLSTIKRFFNLDYENLIVVSHEDKSKDITKKNGSNITRIAPNIQEGIASKIAGMVDIVARVVVEDDGTRTLNFKSNEVVFGGGRLPVKGETVIPLDWDALMEVYDLATEKETPKKEAPQEEPKEEEKPVEKTEETPTRRSRKKREE